MNGEKKLVVKEIVKEVLILAPAAKVWLHLTDPERIAGWLMPNDFEARVGRPFFLDCKEEGKSVCVVKEIVPQKRLVYSYQLKALKIETTVTITLTAEGRGTRVKLVHAGWDKLPPTDRDGLMGGFDRGWGDHVELLRKQVEGAKS